MKRIFLFIFCLLMVCNSFYCVNSNNSTMDHNFIKKSSIRTEDCIDFYEIDLKREILLDYYKLAVNQFNYTNSFDMFCENYEISNKNIYDYVTNNSLESSSSGDKNFRLGFERENITSGDRFKNGRPLYYSFFYDYIEIGDIFFEDESENYYHSGVITSLSKTGCVDDENFTYIQTIEALDHSRGLQDGGVQFGYLDDQRIVEKNIKIKRVQNINSYEIYSVIYFLDRQIGKPYNLIYDPNPSINTSDWFCHELVHAAFSYAGLFNDLGNFPIDIYFGNILLNYSGFINVDFESYDPFLDIFIDYKSGNKWYLRIFNTDYLPHYVKYNKKMCFENAAKNWTNLNDLEEIYIAPGDYSNIVIQENFFAGYITVSFTQSVCGRNERLITYANNLSTNRTLNKERNVIFYE